MPGPNDEYRIPLGLDSETLAAGLSRTIGLLQQTNEAARTTGQGVRDTFTASATAVENSNRVVSQTVGVYNASRNSLAQLSDALQHYKDLAFTETDVNKVRRYNQEIERIKTQINTLSTVGTKAFKEQTGLIERMTAAIQMYKKFVDQATNTEQIAKYNKKIEETTTAVNKLQNAGKAGFDNLGNAIQSNTNLTQGLVNGLKNVAASFGIFIGIQGLITLGKDLFETANKVAGVERAFTNLNRPDLLPKLRAETKGFINDFELERLSVRAKNFNIDLNQLGTLLLFATQRAKETGESVDKLTEDIISGLGRKSIRIIDNLGISAVEVQKEFRKVGDFTTAVTNIIQREMNSAGDYVETLADRTQKASAAFSNFFNNIAVKTVQAFSPTAPLEANIQKNIDLFQKGFANIEKLSQRDAQVRLDQQLKAIQELTAKRRAAQKLLDSGDVISIQNQQRRVRTAGEELAAAQALAQLLKKRISDSKIEERIRKGISSDLEKAAQVEKLRGTISNFIVGVTGTQADKEALIKQANDIQKVIDSSNAKAEGKKEKAAESARAKQARRDDQVLDQKIRIENQLTQLQAEASDDRVKIEIAKENASYQVALNNLEKQKKDFPELVALTDKAIEAEKTAHAFRLTLISKKQKDEQQKLEADAQKAIAKVLATDNDEQLKNIKEQYETLIEQARKAGLLTQEVETKLLEARGKAVNNLRVKIAQDSNKIAEDIELAGIESRKKLAGETEREFELRNQKDILGIKIKYAELALSLINNDPAKAVDAAKLKVVIESLKKDLIGVGKSIENEKAFSFSNYIQKSLGLDDEGLSNLKSAANQVVALFDGVADSILKSYEREIEAGEERIDALKEQLDDANSYFKEQNDLKEKGYANDSDSAQKNVDAIKASLAQEEAARQDNIKRQQEAQKIVATIRAAEIAGNTIEQVSNLATAASKIFKAHAGIPFLGVAIAFGAVAALVAGFLAIKASIKSATETKFKKGGKAGGNSHENGGNKYQSIDGNDNNIIEIERGEYIVNEKSTSKHEKLIEAINKDDFSGLSLNDYSLKALLKGTGVSEQSSIAKAIGAEINAKQDKISSNVIIVSPESSELRKISKKLDKIIDLKQDEENVTDMGDHLLIKKGNVIERRWKKK